MIVRRPIAILFLSLISNFLFPLPSVAAVISPSATFDASAYTASATSWGIGTVPAMAKTSFGPQGVIFAGPTPTPGTSLTATLGAVTETAVTVEMWVKLDTSGSERNAAGSMLFSWGGDPGDFTYNIYHFRGWVGFNTFNSELLGVDVSTHEDKWVHLTFVMKNPLSCTVWSTENCTGQKIYVNGQLQTLTKQTDLTIQTHIQRGFNTSGNFLLMDNVRSANTWNAIGTLGLARIYKGEVDATQAANLYATTKSSYVPFFTLSSPSETRTQNTAATGFTISQRSEVINTFSISPAAPSGMTFNTATGALTGTPTVLAAATDYVVSATNSAGTYTQTFNLTVAGVPVVTDNNAAAETARIAAAAQAARLAKEQKELTEIMAMIPKIGELTLSLGEVTRSLMSTKCVKGKTIKNVKKGAKCPKGFVKR